MEPNIAVLNERDPPIQMATEIGPEDDLIHWERANSDWGNSPKLSFESDSNGKRKDRTVLSDFITPAGTDPIQDRLQRRIRSPDGFPKPDQMCPDSLD